MQWFLDIIVVMDGSSDASDKNSFQIITSRKAQQSQPA